MVLFEASEIVKNFANHLALDKVSIAVPQQSIFGLLGPNGAGKTTLIRIINQITAPDQGQLHFNGIKMKRNDVSRIGYLPEERGLYKKMKVGDQALYLARLKGIPKNDALKKLRYWFEKFEIMSWWNRKVEELSKGMQQKVQFIVTVVHEPELLIFDEPFSGFDPINVNLLKDEIFRLKENGATVIFSTHNMASVEELCDHIALIDQSRKILDGKVRDVRNAYKSNTFEVTYRDFNGPLQALLDKSFRLIRQEEDKEENLQKARIQITGSGTANALIKRLISHLTLNSFNEILPTMNEIFIAKVKEQQRR
ncbi:MAG: ATP-binding cassette domain-containing protein [Bacteroidota bacterium]|nr:ATP-binding cassette domain-containing protein [Bacteroidota bacterium]